MSELLDELKQTLGASYDIERELGGGGMSRVLVARERALGRLVVIKLLPAELSAAVNTERFRREIQLAAQLQHPHIVPLLAAGLAGELLYYTMPFVEGSSLRERIERDGRLGVPEAVRLLREIASALSYAHGRGIAHRDVKPENVLLAHGHALVTDFGIAKALVSTAAAGGESPTQALTGLGVAIGTPAYMAPEQAIADPGTDHRADIYAFGAMAYELLAGTTPFGDRTTPHALLTAHMVERPPPLHDRRPELPAALVELVERCLAKDPGERPQDALALVQALEQLGPAIVSGEAARPSPVSAAAASGSGARRQRLRAWVTVAGVATVMVALAVWFLGGSGDSATASGRGNSADVVTVIPLANETGDPALDPLGRMAADWLTRSLARSELLRLVDAPPHQAGRSAAEAALSVGAGTAVTGRYYRLGDSLQFAVDILDARSGEVLQALDPVAGALGEPMIAIEQLRQRTVGALASRFEPRLAEWARTASRPPTYEAYREFVAGLDEFHARRFPAALAHFERAAAIDTGYVQAPLLMLEVLETIGNYGRADSVINELERRRARLSRQEQASLDEYATSVRGDPAGNLEATFRLHRYSPGGQFAPTLANKLLQANRPREALDTLDRIGAAVGMTAGTSFLLQTRQRILHRLEDHERELETLRELRQRFPQELQWAAHEAVALALTGREAQFDSAMREIRAGANSRALIRTVALEMRVHGRDSLSRAILLPQLDSGAVRESDPALAMARHRERLQHYYLLSEWEQAERAVRALDALDRSEGAGLLGAVVMARRGVREPAERMIAELEGGTHAPIRARNAATQAWLAAALGDRERAVAFLRAAAAGGLGVATWVHGLPELAALRGYAPFDELVRLRG